MNLLCLADIHGKSAAVRAALGAAPSADVIVVAGDITHLGGDSEAEEVLASLSHTGTPVVAVAGNMDRAGVRTWLAQKGLDIHGRGVIINGAGFFGLGGGTHSPFSTPWELEDDEAARLLEAAYADVARAPLKVLVSHAPPLETELDRVRQGVHGGSRPVHSFLLSHRVDLCVCGHIHEGGGSQAVIGGCTCANVGPLKNGRFALVALDRESITVTWRKT